MTQRVRAEEKPAETPAMADVLVYYLGRRADVEGKTCYAIVPVRIVEPDMEFDELYKRSSIFIASKKGAMPTAIGGVYRVKAILQPEDGRIKQAIMHFDYVQEEPPMRSVDLRAGCEARDKAAMIELRARKSHAALVRDSKLMEIMRPLKLRYEGTDSIGKAAMEVAILHELRRGF